MDTLFIGCVRRVVLLCHQFLQCLIKWCHLTYWAPVVRKHPPDVMKPGRWGKHRYLEVHKLQIHYIESGSNSKPLMLFLHGIPDFWYTWRHQIKEFSEDYWTVAIDLPGCGQSDEPHYDLTYKLNNLASLVCGLIDGLGKKDCILVGHGSGALVGWHLLNQYPQRVSKYIMMSLPSMGVLQELHQRGEIPLKVQAKALFRCLPRLPTLYARSGDFQLVDRMFTHSAKPADLEAYKYTFSQPGALERFQKAYRENFSDFLVEEYDFKERKPSQTPGLFLVGDEDRWISPEDCSSLLIEHYQPLEVRYVPRTGRFLQQEDPKTVNRLMRMFLNHNLDQPMIRLEGPPVTKIIQKEVCENCHGKPHATAEQHENCSRHCDGEAHRHLLSKARIPICS
uniref:Putative epoxide hydrolase 4 n=1 Tax=Anopheles darlingi TaxID=43151 RepID=A0A2M4CUW9_ANODA